MSDDRRGPWPGADTYAILETVHPSRLASEWLRRDPDYRRLAPSRRRHRPSGVLVIDPAPPWVQHRWGCLHVGDGRPDWPGCPILWGSRVDRSVLRVTASLERRPGDCAFHLDLWEGRAAIVPLAEQGGEHLLLHEGSRQIRLHVETGTLLDGPVSLRFAFDPQGRFEPPLATLRRFLHLQRTGEWLVQAPLPKRLRARAITALRVHDALATGARLRDIAVMLYGEPRVAEDWRAPGEAMKSQCRRWKIVAREMAKGGFTCLLR